MTIDPTSLNPGLGKDSKPSVEVNMRCKNEDCDSITSIEITSAGSGSRVYQCVKCHRTQVVSVGGPISL
jgi:hypothetical protein